MGGRQKRAYRSVRERRQGQEIGKGERRAWSDAMSGMHRAERAMGRKNRSRPGKTDRERSRII